MPSDENEYVSVKSPSISEGSSTENVTSATADLPDSTGACTLTLYGAVPPATLTAFAGMPGITGNHKYGSVHVGTTPEASGAT